MTRIRINIQRLEETGKLGPSIEIENGLLLDSGIYGLVLTDNQDPKHYWRIEIFHGTIRAVDLGMEKPI